MQTVTEQATESADKIGVLSARVPEPFMRRWNVSRALIGETTQDAIIGACHRFMELSDSDRKAAIKEARQALGEAGAQ